MGIIVLIKATAALLGDCFFSEYSWNILRKNFQKNLLKVFCIIFVEVCVKTLREIVSIATRLP